ncbi:unnamed protein product [Enterobius vermicularis]|uniref:RPAP1_N domain-containing protein n=1 Tax=Enterobius vermicularis TaxID=51028 RepID=A0A0N4VG57_ENTVE|nr:unnamed protein product [Enterobius vermicularis]
MHEGSFPTGRFHLNLDAVKEECSSNVLLDVQEKNSEYLNSEGTAAYCFSNICDEYAKEDGFPEVLDLSRYEVEPLYSEGVESDIFDDVSEENEKRIRSLTDEEIKKAQREIYERFVETILICSYICGFWDLCDLADEKTVKFLLSRGQRSCGKGKGKKGSYFKESRLLATAAAPISTKETEENSTSEEKIKQLEVFTTARDQTVQGIPHSFGVEEIPHARIAAEAVHLDFISKCAKSLVPRKQQNILRLFDGLEKEKSSDDSLIKTARANLPAIKGLYLDERPDSSGISTYKFASDINPLEQSCWMLSPIRKVLDVCEKDGNVSAEDVVVVRIALLWTVLLMSERPSLFQAFTSPRDTYVRISEIFLIGSEVFMDDCVRSCVDRILQRYIVPKALDRLLSFQLADQVAGLDAFLPFYEDLIKHYEEDGMGDELFSQILLFAAYMNSNVKDGLMMKCALWTPQRQLSRMMIIGCKDGAAILKYLKETRDDDAEELETDCYAQYSQLLAMYAKAIREDFVTRERNPLMYEIAATDLGFFVSRHEQRIRGLPSNEGTRRVRRHSSSVTCWETPVIIRFI